MKYAVRGTIAVAVVAAIHLHADGAGNKNDWNQYRGPDRNGISKETGWLAKWPEGGPTRLWEKSVGRGYASVSVSAGRVYAMGHRDGSDVVYCLSAETGETVWEYAYACDLMAKMHKGGPAGTPTIDGDRIFTYSKLGHLHCLRAAKKQRIWVTDVRAELGAKVPTWGFATSPLVVGKLVIVDAGHAAAFDRNTGKLVWKSQKDYKASYSSPVALKLGGKECVAVFNAFGLVVLQLADGKEVCAHKWETKYGVNAATPIVQGDRAVISSGYGRGAALLRLGLGKTDVVWEGTQMRNQMNTSVLWEGHLYGFDDKTLKCIDFDRGGEKWAQSGLGKGSLMLADGKLIILTEGGELVIAKADPGKFDKISRARVLAGQCWTVPVLSDGRIYCRNSDGNLVCLDVRGN